jgi:hypothetical protein
MSVQKTRTIRRSLAPGLCLAVLLAGMVAREATADAIQATKEIPEQYLLDVAIEILDPGIPDPATTPPKKMKTIFPELRRSEARFIPVRIRETLGATGHWGAVRVVPAGMSSSDLTIAGEIRESTGRDLVLRIRAVDASGHEWLDRKYQSRADFLAYSEEELADRSPYQGLYDELANDLLAVKQKLDLERLLELRQITQLRFASELVPSVFTDYLKVNPGHTRYKLKRLPTDDDPMMARVGLIRERDYMLVDTLNEHYGEFVTSMEASYDNWRAFSYEEQVALAELRRQARTRKILGALAIFGAIVSDADSSVERAARDAALIGGIAAIESGINKGKEAKIHVEALAELSASFESEVAPMVIEVHGETVRLTGSREEQYATWRQLLKKIYAAETGQPQDPNLSADLAVEGSTHP